MLWKTQRTMKETVQRKINHSSWMNMLLPTQGARNEYVESLHKTKTSKNVLSCRACPCFPSRKKVVRRLKFISSALLLSSLRYRFVIAFSGSLSDSFSPAPRVHFSRQANKERHYCRFKSCDLDSLVRWRTNNFKLLPLDRKDTAPS